MKIHKNARSLVLAAFCICLTGCVDQSQKDTAVETKRSENVLESTVSKKQQVILATSMATVEICEKLEIELAGIPSSNLSGPPECYAGLPEIGNAMAPDMEVIAAMNPDRILSPVSLYSDLKPKYEGIKAEYAFLNLSSVAGMYKSIEELGRMFGKEEQAEQLIREFEDFYKEFQERNEDKERPTLLILMGFPGSYVVATENSYVGNLAALAVSGVLFQAVLKNPLTDPGIIGISGGAGFAGVLFTAFFPQLITLVPIVSFAGGFTAFLLVYSLSWKEGLSPLRIVLVGVAVSTMFGGLSSAFHTLSGGSLTGVAAIIEGNITMKTWDDVRSALYFIPVSLVISMLSAKRCNLLALDDKTAKGIGLNVNSYRLMISVVAVLLASISTAIAGIVSFVGLLVPHIARILVGNNHKILLPYSMLLGGLVFLSADTVGRILAPPYEVNASIIMAAVGGPFFVMLLKRRARYGS